MEKHRAYEAAKTAVGVELVRFMEQVGGTMTFDARNETFEERCGRIACAVLRAIRDTEDSP